MKAGSRSNINKYYLYQLFNSLEFFAPVIVLFWTARGLTMTQIMFLQSIYAICVIILELPTGALADYFGKKISLILGALFYTAGFIIYGLSFKFWQFALGEIVVGAGMAFISGADRAFIHETLKSINRERDYRKIEGKTRAITQVARAVANLAGGFIGSISLGLTLIVTGFSSFFSVITGLSFKETKINLPREEKTEFLQIIQDSLKIVRENKEVLWLTLFFAIFNSIIWSVNWFAQLYLKAFDIPIVYFGIIFASFSVVSAFGSSLVTQFDVVTKNRPFLIMGLISVLVMGIIGVFPSPYVFPLWSLLSAFIVMNQILVSDKVLGLIPSDRAATILSFQNLLRRFIYAGFGPIIGVVSDRFGIFTAIQFNAIVLAVVLTVLYIIKKKKLKPVS